MLGAVEVRTSDGDVVPLPSRRVTVLLAALVLRVNRTMPVDELVDLLWNEDELPSNPRSALQIYVSRLRTTIGDTDRTTIATAPGGYSLRAEPANVDVEVFRELVREATGIADPAARIDTLGRALALWRGRPLAGLDIGTVSRELVPRLDEEHLQAQELYFDACLAAGESTALVPELTELAERHPARERVWAQLISAHRASGRTALALSTYADVADRLRELLGADPGPELQRLHAELLAPTELGVVPRQLPAGVPAFTGRTDDLERLDQLLPTAGLGLVIGPAGVGKTSLAVHWARQVADRFPDGILYADLLGFSPVTEPADPLAVLSRFLVALGTAPDRLPANAEEQIALYRSLLADRAVLVVLDNARSADQVRPLATTGSRCRTVVTSRNELAGLVATEQAEPIRLDVFDALESKQLLAARIGAERFRSDPASVDALAERCAGLPLALSLIAAQIALRPHRSLASFVSTLGEGPLDALSTADGVGVRTIFSWSYRQLRPELARMFRLVAQHPGTEITPGAAAALAGVPVREARRTVGELVANHQLIEIEPDRWVLHDLLRAYGQELCEPGEADAALERLLGYLVHTGFAAAVLLAPSRVRVALPELPADAEVVAPATRDEAFAWFDAEQPNNLAVLRAAAGRADELLWLCVWTIADYLDFRGRSGYAQAQQLALEAAVRLGDLRKQAHTRRDLARGHMAMREWDEAIRQHELALGIAEELDDQAGIAHGSLGLGRVYTRIGDHRRAIEHTQRALRIYERTGHVDARANALNNLGWYHSELGEYEAGLDYAQQSLKLYAEVDSEFGRAVASDTSGYALAGLGRIDEAIALYTVAVETLRGLGRRLDTADCLMAMARVQDRAGRGDGARASYAAALEILDDLEHPDAETVRKCLAQQR
ncbi:BTAD domain-containing putative transcriptional regulator [Kribbella sp. VKM Ac-2566]|uniref:AfsR/SARP family transcriptional regulator n=1 Tax=Kribbella sp. VKM Ac-2566 TaxID=2512218 RepID=UPI0010EA4457|nr:BTAD domain-containing putative transcriptional regulator [Kribbella sp. VKM Ac-2566]TDX03241.1 DNA-binding SARP family transcriptional activator [Kribbella sp. VKM Ac-2566]